jgi:dTDP-4-dehydrorhamnose reductase
VKIGITGTTGRVGAALASYFASLGEDVLSFDRSHLNLTNLGDLDHLLDNIDVLINPAALSAPDECENFPEQANAINHLAPLRMAELCKISGKTFVHFSTDYVFSGNEVEKRRENDEAHAINVYGASKRAGEIAVMQANPAAIILRVSWVYGADKPAYVEQTFQKILNNDPLEAIADKWSIPTSMKDLCQWVNFLLKHQASGIHHACNAGEPVSWHGIAVALQESMLHQGLISSAREIMATKLSDISHFSAPRPIHTAMDNSLLSHQLPQPIRHWRDALDEFVRDQLVVGHHKPSM